MRAFSKILAIAGLAAIVNSAAVKKQVTNFNTLDYIPTISYLITECILGIDSAWGILSMRDSIHQFIGSEYWNATDNNVLEVTLAAGDNAVVHATVKNTGTEALNLLKYGTLFDSAPVQKVAVYEGKNAVPFKGILRSIQRTDLAPEVFHTLAAGETYETTFNAAEVHDLSSSTYTFVAEGTIPVAPSDPPK
ncbi:hypothetical protein EAF04_004780 [Stromatinia cepivora]|nr:hypothetical protein EAF04_004780 [Stromatinia cepivora]